MLKKTVDDINFQGKKVFLRCDFNVPLDDNLNITNDLRIVNALPTVKKILADGGRLIMASHLGRPKGDRIAAFSLKPVAKRLSELLNLDVPLLDDCIGKDVEDACSDLQNGEALLLENVRFHKAETAKTDDPCFKVFSTQLASLADVFVGDAFGSAHRAHASVVGPAASLPAVCGYLLAKELEYFSRVMNAPEKPVVAILGGAKVSDKIMLIENLLERVDQIIIGGGMAYTFQAGLGRHIGKSIFEEDKMETAMEIMKKAVTKGVKIILPVDTVIADDFCADANTEITSDDIPETWEGVDIGPQSIAVFKDCLSNAKVVVWNGPMGAFEISPFSKGTEAIAKVLADLDNATTVIGGGDTAAAVFQFNLEDKMSHISTGGGASLELLEGKVLPGVSCLNDKCP